MADTDRGVADMTRAVLGVLLAPWFLFTVCPAGEPLTVRAVRPDEQGGRLIALFSGSRAPDPAAALAAWKNAGGKRNSLGKPLEAAVAALNPSMVRELAGLDGAELRIGFATATGKGHWRAVVPADDGRFAALGPALALTGGAVEEPIGGDAVFRLGPTGSTVLASRRGRLALASDRDGLGLALDGLDLEKGPDAGDDLRPGWHARLDPGAMRDPATLTGRRFAEAIAAVGCQEVNAWLVLGDDALTLRVTSALEDRPRGGGTGVDPSWLDAIPSAGTLAAVSFAIDTRAEALDAAFAVLDRIERADPARAGVAPSRTRLNLIAAAARVRPEVDVWPRLKGLTAAVMVDALGDLSGALIVLHAADADSARRFAGEVLPRLSSTFTRGEKGSAVGSDGVRTLGTVAGKPVSAATRGSGVVIGWGDGALSAALRAIESPARSAGGALRAGWGASPPHRAGGFWPGRFRRLAAPGSELAGALEGGPPVVWEGSTGRESARDVVRWDGLRGVVRRWLDALPLDPPRDR